MNSSRRSRLLWAVFAVIAAGALAAIYLLTGGSGTGPVRPVVNTPSPGAEGEPGTPSASEAPTSGTKLTVYMDGWSFATLSASRITAASNAPSDDPRQGAQDVQNVLFVPMSAQEVADLGASDPDVLGRVAARMVSTDDALACDDQGCRSGAGEVGFDALADPSRIAGLGASYKGYGVKSSLYKAQVTVPAEAPSITLSAEGWNGIELKKDIPATSEVDDASVEDGGEVQTITVEPDANNGYLKNTFVVSAGLGRFFTPTPSWVGEQPLAQQRREGLVTGLEVAGLPVEATAGPLFARGLGAPVSLTSGLTDSQMTFITSPTTGCGVGVMCVPGAVDTVVESFTSEPLRVCTADGSSGVVVVENSVWSFDLEHPTSIHGAWNGSALEDFAGKGSSVVYTGQAPLVSGPQRLKESTIRLYDTPTSVTLVASAGQMAQEGQDSAELFDRQLSTDDISGSFGGIYSAC